MVFTCILRAHCYCSNYSIDWPESNGAIATAKVCGTSSTAREILRWRNFISVSTRRFRYEHVYKSRPTCASEFRASMLLLGPFYVACLFCHQTSGHFRTPRMDDKKFCFDTCRHHITTLCFCFFMVG